MAEFDTAEPLAPVQDDEFLKLLKTPTEKDNNPDPGPVPPVTPPADKDKKAAEEEKAFMDNPELIAELVVEMFDIFHNNIMKGIAKELEGSAFAVTKKQKDDLKKPLTTLIRSYQTTMRPEVLLLLMVAVMYGPSTIKAFEVRKKKQKAEEEAAAKGKKPAPVEIKRGPGRPVGS